MFRTLKYQHDLATDEVEIKIVMQVRPNGNMVDDGGYFKTKMDADIWFARVKKDYLLSKLEIFICSAEKIIDLARGHKSLQPKRDALAIVRAYLVWAVEKATLYESCKWLIEAQDHFKGILPSELHPEYHQHFAELKTLLSFCANHLDGSLKRTA